MDRHLSWYSKDTSNHPFNGPRFLKGLNRVNGILMEVGSKDVPSFTTSFFFLEKKAKTFPLYWRASELIILPGWMPSSCSQKSVHNFSNCSLSIFKVCQMRETKLDSQKKLSAYFIRSFLMPSPKSFKSPQTTFNC